MTTIIGVTHIMTHGLDSVSSKITLVIGHPNEVIREGIVDILEKADFKVISKFNDMTGVYNSCSDLVPDIIMIDVGLEGFCLDAITKLANKAPTIVVTPNNISEQAAAEVLNAGASGLVSVDEPVHNFIRALRAIAGGDIVVSKGLAKNFRRTVSTKTPTQYHSTLTDRESEVLGLLGGGLTNREIGERLFVSEHTVKVHLRNVLTKLNLRNRQQAAAYAAQHGLARQDKQESTP